MKLFLDTCVLIDYFARRRDFYEGCLKLRIAQMFGDVELWVSAKSFTDVFYVVQKAVGAESLQKAIADSAEFLHICSVDGGDVVAAATMGWPDLEDALVCRCAQKVKADYLLTRDADGFGKSPVPTFSPVEFFDMWAARYGVNYDYVGDVVL